MSWPWSELGLDGPSPLDEVHHAYAQRLKETHPEEDPDGFQRLHQAYQAARRTARKLHKQPPQPAAEEMDVETPPASSALNPSESVWAFDEMLQPDSPPLAPEPEPPSAPAWDYEQLLKEGEAQRLEARRRQYQSHQTAPDSQEDLEAVQLALMQLAALVNTYQPPSEWMKFVHSGLFFRVKSHPEFRIALEDVLDEHPNLEPTIRNSLLDSNAPPTKPIKVRTVWGYEVIRSNQANFQKPNPHQNTKWKLDPSVQNSKLLYLILTLLGITLVFFQLFPMFLY